ncbi:hypothetical protein DFS33DRAFT_214337 [Desarmillaria ectypa]|nr:hypothetical protein DFS33DRAFT_214337 [Desarmillaria ectypa]
MGNCLLIRGISDRLALFHSAMNMLNTCMSHCFPTCSGTRVIINWVVFSQHADFPPGLCTTSPMDDDKPQLIGPLDLCFNLKRNGVYIRVDRFVVAELTLLATELLNASVGDMRNQVKKRLLSICDSWTVRKRKKYLHDYPKPKNDESLQPLRSASSGEGSANINKFIDIVFSPPRRNKIPSEGVDQWRDSLLSLLQNMSVQDREASRQRVLGPVWVELVKPSIRAEHLDLLKGTTIEKHDISDWYAIPIGLPKA